ncbi:hypothetical protein [Pacificoceanicola onchidii]|uniref:hypothetical protein n=1 Tax=Pacificoceanicola onchidii TaxID=2562685 RepID=UPI0010A56CC6|nr:hypothetical protein [Pacificoceanicola onchidii]
MNIARTLNGLMARNLTPDRARELGQLGYMQWLGTLPANADYVKEAGKAYAFAEEFIDTDPAVAAFCALVRASQHRPLQPLDLALPKAKRRGGARSRRLSI